MNRAVPIVPRRPRSPWQLLYGAAHRLRRHWYRSRAARLPHPVISVGNLHWGGTGKTPLVAAVARRLAASGHRVTILSRGYGRKSSGVQLVSEGKGPMLGPRVAGDEPVALAGELPGVAVVVGGDRYLAGRHAIERLPQPPDCFVLDDGFSHLALARDLDILVLPERDPFGGGRLAPSGRLREPLTSARHASAVLLSGAEPSGAELSGLEHPIAGALRPFGFRGPGFSSRTRVLDVETERKEELPAAASLLLVTGIANPDRFEQSVTSLPNRVVDTLRFSDHHDYGKSDLERITSTARDTGADWILTTTKDYVKLLGRLDMPLAHLPIRAEPEEAFFAWLDRELEAVS